MDLAAIGQGDGLLDEPDDVAGELGDLGVGQRDAGAQLMRLGEGGCATHEDTHSRLKRFTMKVILIDFQSSKLNHAANLSS